MPVLTIHKSTITFLCLLGSLLYYYTSCQFTSNEQGKQLYQQHCQNCHGPQGKGLRQIIPPVSDTPYLIDSLTTTVCIIQYGSTSNSPPDYTMPGNEQLSPVQIANIINFINKKWNQEYAPSVISDQAVKEQLRRCRH